MIFRCTACRTLLSSRWLMAGKTCPLCESGVLKLVHEVTEELIEEMEVGR